MTSAPPGAYRTVLSRPRVLTTFSISMIGRSAYALVFLPLFYAAQQASSSMAFAGITVAVYGAGATFLAPVRAWLIDRFGARRMLSILVVGFGLALSLLAVASLVASPAWVLAVLAGLAGSVAPPLGPTMRVAWGRLVSGVDERKAGLSLDAVVEELLYLAGPAVAGLFLLVLAPGHAMLVPAVLVTVGGLFFVRTSAVSQMRGGSVRGGSSRVDAPAPSRPLIFTSGFVGLVIPALVAGGISGLVSVVVPAASEMLGGPAMVGIALGVFAGGSAAGGLLYGGLKVPGAAARQLTVLSVLLVVGASFLAIPHGAVVMIIVLGCAGLFFSPVMIVAYLAAPPVAAEDRQNAATTWVSTSHNLGATVASAATGIMIELADVPVAVLAVCGAGLVLVVVSVMLQRPCSPGPWAVSARSADR